MSLRGWGGLFVVGALCAIPALSVGFYSDDYLHLARLHEGGTAHQRLMSLFTFTSGGAETHALIANGAAPWWTAPDLQLHFFRPLSAALMLVDAALFGLRPLGYHLHSYLWWLLWLAGTGLLFRRLFSARLGLLAFALFAIDDAHWLPIGWIAGRNAVVAMAFMIWGLLAYLRFRQDAWRPGALLAAGAWVLALLASEAALSGLMYVVAYEILQGAVARRSALRAALRRLWPLGLLLGGYAVLYRLSGAGVRGSGAYIDPIHDRLAFIGAAAARVPAQFGALIFGAPLDLWLLTALQPIFVVVGLVAIVVVTPWFLAATAPVPASARDGDGDRDGARWLALGSVLSLIPTSAGLLGERSLAAASVGAAALVAVLLGHGLKKVRAAQGFRRIALAAGLAAVALPNLVVAGPWLVTKLVFLRANGKALEQIAATAATAPPARTVLLWSDDVLLASYTGGVARITHPGALSSFRVLAMAPVDLLITRVAPDELELACRKEPLLTSAWEGLFRSPAQALPAGTVIALDGLTVRVVQDIGGRPSRVRFRFDAPVDDPSWRFLEWRGRRLVPAVLPALGETRPVFRSPPLLTAASDD